MPLGNAFAAADDVAAVQAICDGLDEGKIAALAARWLGILPHPVTAEDTAAGYRYELSVLQAEWFHLLSGPAAINRLIILPAEVVGVSTG